MGFYRSSKENLTIILPILDGFRGKKWLHFSNADLLIMPSRWEAFGLVAVEAQSYGLPVLASRCASLPEVVLDGKSGLLFDVGSVDDLVRQVQRFSVLILAMQEKNPSLITILNIGLPKWSGIQICFMGFLKALRH